MRSSMGLGDMVWSLTDELCGKTADLVSIEHMESSQPIDHLAREATERDRRQPPAECLAICRQRALGRYGVTNARWVSVSGRLRLRSTALRSVLANPERLVGPNVRIGPGWKDEQRAAIT